MSQSESSAAVEPVLSVRRVSKRFGGTQAVADVSFAIGRGEIVALLGENGAGKSTMIKMLAGVHLADSGSFHFGDARYDPRQGHPGIAFIHQDLGLIEWMTVAENIGLMHNSYPRRFGMIHWAAVRREATRVLAIVTDSIDPDTRVHDLTRTEKSLVAIARALARDVTLLVLDEPTASLPQSDVEMLHGVLRRLRGDGVAMIYVSHRLDEVFAIADRAVILRDGRLAADEPIGNLDGESLIELIIGRELEEVFARPALPVGSAKALELDSLRTDTVGPVSLAVHAGEVLSLVGLRGAGQEGVGQALFGLEPIVSGCAVLGDGRALTSNHPRTSIARGICMVAGDRNADSIAHGLSVQENLYLNPRLSGRGAFSFRLPGAEQLAALELGRTFDIRPNDPAATIETLSGGNQQKVVMARWMSLDGSVLILEDPTAGVDVGSKADIYALLSKALSNGLAVLLISTDFEEVAALSHRACVFRDGSIVARLAQDELSIQSLLTAASLDTQSATDKREAHAVA